jgi:tetratricopeptide (TPR) repeat protein
MLSDERIDLEVANATAYDDLVAAIDASDGVLSLLLAVCDDPQLREATIRQYEAELQPKILPYRIEMPRTEPSLRRVIAEKIAQEPYLHKGGRAVLTVTGAEGLSFLTLGEEKSEQDTFLGYLQWTREALRTFQYPIVLWVTSQLLAKLSRKAPDFWSWRKDVFRFVSKKTETVSSLDIEPLRPVFESLGLQHVSEDDAIPLEDLRQLIVQSEARLGNDRNDKLLATLYARIGRICAIRIEQGKSPQYQTELQEALDYFRKAAEIQIALGLENDLSDSLNWQGCLYESKGLYDEAEPLFVRALEIRENQLDSEHPDVAASLNNLARLYESQGRYDEAESLFVRSLEVRQRQLGEDHPHVAVSLSNLASIYQSQGQYNEAETLYRQSLQINGQQLGADHSNFAASLNNLAGLYELQGRYEEAKPLLIRSLGITEQQLGSDHPNVAVCLHNLAELYRSQGSYNQAEELHRQSLEIWERQLGMNHPNVAGSLNSLAFLYQTQGRYDEAEPFYLKSLEIKKRYLNADHPDVGICFNNLAELYKTQCRYGEAEPLYIEALRILTQLSEESEFEHPNLQTGLENFCGFLTQVMQEGRQAELSNHPATQALLKQLQSDAEAS